jgi:hypothetical protein
MILTININGTACAITPAMMIKLFMILRFKVLVNV